MIGLYVVVCFVAVSFACLHQLVVLDQVSKRRFFPVFTSTLSTVQVTVESATAAYRYILSSKFAARDWYFVKKACDQKI